MINLSFKVSLVSKGRTGALSSPKPKKQKKLSDVFPKKKAAIFRDGTFQAQDQKNSYIFPKKFFLYFGMEISSPKPEKQ